MCAPLPHHSLANHSACAHEHFNWWAEEALEKYDYARFPLTKLISHQDHVVTNQITESRELRMDGRDQSDCGIA